LNADEKTVYQLLKEKGSLSIDEINLCIKLSSSAIASALLTMELNGVVMSMPGKMYTLS
jgi:DNA processing protein